jgi:hypothetical protein
MNWLKSPKAKAEIVEFKGYDTQQTGQLVWIE